MRAWALLPLSLLAACGEAEQPAAPSNVGSSEVPSVPENKAERASPPSPPRAEAPAEPPSDYPGVAELSASQRRAYERGWRDCRAGRYAPAEWAEAYRIGCAAAQEGR